MGLSAVELSVISRALQHEQVMISSIDLELLDALYSESEALRVEDISKKFNLDLNLTKMLLKELGDKKFVETNSPKYKISQDGKKLIELAREVASKLDVEINKDTYLQILNSCTSTIMQK